VLLIAMVMENVSQIILAGVRIIHTQRTVIARSQGMIRLTMCQ